MRKIRRRLFSFFVAAMVAMSFLPIDVLAAEWKISATLVMCANGGEFSDGSERYFQTRETTASTGGLNYVAINITSSKAPVKTGHIFKGWAGMYDDDLTQGVSSTLYGLSVSYKNGQAVYLNNKETDYLVAL